MRRIEIKLLLILALFLPSCASKPPVNEEKFADFYVGLQLVDAKYGGDSRVQKEKADSLMKANGFDQGLLDSTMRWYSKKPERWADFFRKVDLRLKKMKIDSATSPRR